MGGAQIIFISAVDPETVRSVKIMGERKGVGARPARREGNRGGRQPKRERGG